MTKHRLGLLRLLLLGTLFGLPAARSAADSGTVQAIERVGKLQVSVFTSPAVLVPGEADISVLVQDVETSVAVENCEIDLTLTPQGRPYAAQHMRASRELATNKLFQACHTTLAPGRHDLEVAVTAGDQRATVRCIIEVGESPPKAASFWPWFTWPVVPIVVFAVGQWRKRS